MERTQRCFIRQPIGAAAINRQHPGNKIVMTVAYALISGIIVLWVAYLSAVTSAILSSLNIIPNGHLAFSSIVNRESKSDRLPGVTFEQRWSAFGELDAARPTATIPVRIERVSTIRVARNIP